MGISINFLKDDNSTIKLLHKNDNIKFFMDREFNIKYLSLIQRFVQCKLERGNWDDYNELYHACKFINLLKLNKNIWFETHLLTKDDMLIGVLFIVGGKTHEIEKKYNIENEENSLLLKYFHIVDKGKGYGSMWLKSVILPFYKERNYKKIYLSSSHKDSFPFYKRLGQEIVVYEQESDNEIEKRIGNCFLIDIK